MKNRNVEYKLSSGEILNFMSHQDLFSPSNIDKGTLAMLKNVVVSPEDKVLDLGCGYGFVGIYLARKYAVKDITMCDIDENAVSYAKQNVKLNNTSINKVFVSDGFSNVKDKDYTLILSNPPYHTDFKVAKGFIENGYKSLVVGGKMVMVVKRLLWYKNKLNTIFGGVKVIEEDNGYYILIAEKRYEQKPPKKEKKVKQKHLKRLEKTKNRSRKRKS